MALAAWVVALRWCGDRVIVISTVLQERWYKCPEKKKIAVANGSLRLGMLLCAPLNVWLNVTKPECMVYTGEMTQSGAESQVTELYDELGVHFWNNGWVRYQRVRSFTIHNMHATQATQVSLKIIISQFFVWCWTSCSWVREKVLSTNDLMWKGCSLFYCMTGFTCVACILWMVCTCIAPFLSLQPHRHTLLHYTTFTPFIHWGRG